MSNTFRAFLAFELPRSVLSGISDVQSRLKTFGFNIRWVRTENIHLTLKFFGDILETDTCNIETAVNASLKDQTPISLEARGVGVFPDTRRPRVLWVGISGEIDRLVKLQVSIADRLVSLGFPKEGRPFRGHLTLGRTKGKLNPAKIEEALDENRGFCTNPFTVDALYLFKSDLNPSGAVYSKVRQMFFGKRPAPGTESPMESS